MADTLQITFHIARNQSVCDRAHSLKIAASTHISPQTVVLFLIILAFLALAIVTQLCATLINECTRSPNNCECVNTMQDFPSKFAPSYSGEYHCTI